MALILFVFGLVFGSFYNVLIWRIPRKQSVISPGSHCPNCNNSLSFIELIPVFSFAIQGGRCRSCKKVISVEYPIIELVTALGFVFFGLSATSWQQLLANIFFFSCLLISATIDFHHKILPNMITFPGIIFALLFSVFQVTIPFFQSLLGIIIGGGILLLVAILSKGGMGMGDVKLLALIGGFIGPYGALISLFFASALGAVIGSIYLLATKQDKKTPIPFGPFLAIGAVGSFWYLLM